MSLWKYFLKRGLILFGVLMATLLLTVLLVGSNMDAILKKGVAIDVRTQIIENKKLVAGDRKSTRLNSVTSLSRMPSSA